MSKKANKIEPAKAPSTWTDHAFERFVDRWWPMPKMEAGPGISTAPIVKALRERTVYFRRLVCTNAYFVENVPDEDISIWGFYMTEGPVQGFSGLLVVDRSGCVRTVLPPATKKQ